jgi:hypothetical protein
MEHPVLQILLKTDPRKPYAADLLRPFHGTCWAGWAAALGTVRQCLWISRGCNLPSNEEGQPPYNVPCAHLLRVLAAADQAQGVAFHSEQLGGLLSALTDQSPHQQQQQQVEGALQQSLAQVSLDDKQAGSLSWKNLFSDNTSSLTFNPSSSSSRAVSLSSGSTMGVVNDSSSGSDGSRATGAGNLLLTAAPHTPPKPCGAWLTTVGVEGVITAATMQQLVSLLDLLPRAQRLQHVEVRSLKAGAAPSSRRCDMRWRGKEVQAALEEDGTTTLIDITASSSRGSSSSDDAVRGGTSIRTCVGVSSSTSSTSTGGAVGPLCLDTSTWRSSCRTLYCHGQHGTVRIADLVPLLESVQQLRGVDLADMDCAGLPGSVSSSFQQLLVLSMTGVNNMSDGSLWAAVAQASRLQSLSATGSRDLTSIPPEIGNLGYVTRLDLSRTGITSSGLEAVGGMTSLRELKLFDCWSCTTLPNNISRLIRLQSLELTFAAVARLPDSISALTGLSCLDWHYYHGNSPVQLEEVWGLRGLQHLSLYLGSGATAVPTAIRQLTALTHLTLYGATPDYMEDLSATLAPLQQLRQLNIRTVGTGHVPDSITALTQLLVFSVPGGGLQLSPAVKAFVKAHTIPSPFFSFGS